ncbi:hypothetical protein L1887_27637 [Cichorium endivia]|nr:hypothetical protein L1887_27637 [Cichorium endivia]
MKGVVKNGRRWDLCDLLWQLLPLFSLSSKTKLWPSSSIKVNRQEDLPERSDENDDDAYDDSKEDTDSDDNLEYEVED